MKYKKFLAAVLCASMLTGNVLTSNAEMKFEAGLPAQEDSSEHLVEVLPPMSDLPAFPGAEGYAEYVTGGRGGKVIHVTNLNTNGEGSLAAALDNGGKTDEPRIIVFDVAGTIQLDKTVAYSKSIKNVTIAGQTAPGEGITLTGENFYLKGSENVIIRFIHFRHGQATAKDDSFYVQASSNIMIDHCSFTYGSDEDCSARQTKNLTIQWSIVTSGVRTHSMGGLQEWSSETIHHCLWGNQNDRNPKAKGIMDFTNNVIYNWGEYPFVAGGNSGGQGWGNVVNNYYIAGLDTKDPYHTITRSNGKYFLYLGGNIIDSNKNGVLDGVSTGVDMINSGSEGNNNYPERFTFPYDYSMPLVLIKNRMNMALLENMDTAEEAYAKVLEFAGASLYHNQSGSTILQHDDIDAEIMDGVRNQTGKILLHNAESHDENGVRFDQNYINSREVINVNDAGSEWYRPDADQDGMPDAWELEHGLDPNNPEDRNNIAPSGYTWIEEYLNELAAPAFPDENYSASAELAAAANRPERTYVLKLENYNGETKEYEGIYGDNQVMVPLVPIAEYLGYKVLGVTDNVVTLEYPFEAASGLLNLDVKSGVITVKAGESRNVFSGGINPNEKPVNYNGMLYIPVNLISLGMGAVYEQTVVDEANNKAEITILDAEIFKEWHKDGGIRDARKAAAPSMVVQYMDGGFKIVFDKEAAVSDKTAVVTVTAGGTDYTASVEAGNVWGSHKVASFKYSDFKAANGNTLSADGLTAYTVKVGAGAYADYYKDALTNVETSINVDLAAQMSEKAAKQAEAQALSDEIAPTLGEGGQEEYIPEDAPALSVVDAVKAIYRLLSMKEINAIMSDQINFDEEVIIPQPSEEPTPEPTEEPIPTEEPTSEPTIEPTIEPTAEPTTEPTAEPTTAPVVIKPEVSNVIPEDVMTEDVKNATGCGTVEELVEYIVEDVMNRAMDVFNKFLTESRPGYVAVEGEVKTEVRDVRVLISTDGGNNWEEATAENFPKNGLDIILEYPEGINKDNRDDYVFVVSHLITMSIPGSDLKPGDIVTEDYVLTDDGLQLHIMSASPFTIGWTRVEQVVEEQPDEDDGDDGEDTNSSTDNNETGTTPGKTGDSMGSFMWIWITVLVLAAAGAGGFAFLKMRGRNKDGNKTE